MSEQELDLSRFGRIVRERREHLGFQQEEMSDQGGPSSTTMSKVERGELAPSRLTLRRLDIGLQWTPGSAQATLNGGDPEPLVMDFTPTPQQMANAHERTAVVDSRIDVNARWNVAMGLVDAVLAQPNATLKLRARTFEVAWMVGDLLTERVLASEQAKYSKEILDRMYESRFTLRQKLLPKEEVNELEVEAESDAPPEGDEDQEAGRSLNKSEAGPSVVDRLGGHVSSDAVEVERGDHEADQAR